MKLRTEVFSSKEHAQSGASLVEFAISLPVLAIFLFGIIQWGLIISAYISLNNAASLVVRQLTIANAPANNSQAQIDLATTVAAQALQSSVNMDINNLSTPTIATVNLGEDISGTPIDGVAVNLSYSMPLFFPFVVPGANNGAMIINASTLMH